MVLKISLVMKMQFQCNSLSINNTAIQKLKIFYAKVFHQKCQNHLIMAIDDFVKGQAIGMMRCGRKVKGVAEALGVSRTIVSRWWKRWQCEGSLLRRKGSGRPRKTGRKTDSKLILSVKRNRFEAIPRLAIAWMSAAGVRCSVRTAYRRIADAGFKSYRPVIRIPLSKLHKIFSHFSHFSVFS